MANEPILTVIGNLTADPELRFTPNGKAVANFTVAQTPRTYDKQTSAYKDGDALFMRCTLWGESAERLVESASKGTRIIATGRLRQRSFETREGEKRTVVELDVDEVGVSVKFATARVSRAERTKPASQAPQDDPWGSAPASSDDQAPF